jgi:hypothetical protein
MDKAWMDAATERIDRLERDNRRLIGLVMVTIIGALALVVEGSGMVRPRKTVEAQSFVLRDTAGMMRAELSLKPDMAPQLVLYDPNGLQQIALDTHARYPSTLTLFGKGQMRAQLLAAEDGTSYLKFLNRDGEDVSTMYLYPDNSTGLTFTNGARSVRLALQADGTWKVNEAEAADESSVFSLRPTAPIRMVP